MVADDRRGWAIVPSLLGPWSRRVERLAMVVVLGLVVALTVGLLQKIHHREESEARALLADVTRNRAAWIAVWTRDRVASARLVASYPTLQTASSPSASSHDRERAQRLLDDVDRLTSVERLAVVRRDGTVALSATRWPPPDELDVRLAQKALDLGAAAFEFHVERGVCHGELALPLASTGENPSKEAALVERLDVASDLFLRLASSVAGTKTGTTLLVGRSPADGRWVGLSDGSASPAGVASAEALAHFGEFTTATDPQGEDVWSVAQPVRDSEYAVLGSMRTEEVLEDVRAQSVLVLATLALAVSAVVWAAVSRGRTRRVVERSRQHQRDASWAHAIESVGDAVLFLDSEGRVVAAHGAAERLYGRLERELVGRPALDLWSAADRALGEEVLRAALPGEPVHRESWHVRPDGTTFPVEIRSIAVPSGPTAGLAWIVRDTTAARDARDRERRLWTAIDQSPVSVVVTDTRGDIEYVNPAFTAISGYSFDDVKGRNPRLLASGLTPRAVFSEMWTAITSGRRWKGELCNRRKDGTLFWEEAVVAPVTGSDGSVTRYIAIKEDVTARKATEERLRETQSRYLQAQKLEAVGRLAGGVAHDFNNLLSVILGYSEMVKRDVPDGSPAAERLGQVVRAGQRAAGLTRQLLAFSRRQVMAPTIADLNVVVTDLGKMLTRLIGEDIRLETHLGGDACAVRVDVGQMEQVLVNLAVNARDAMPRGGTIVIRTAGVTSDGSVAAHHETVPAGRYVRLTVADTGTGMDARTRERVFEPFFTTKPSGQGTGLGLATVFGIVKQSGGYVGFESEPGRGTSFHVWLPCASLVPMAAEPDVDGVSGGTETILVVEDQDAVREVARTALAHLGYEAIVARDAEDAARIALARDGRVDLLLTDVVMPGPSGRELAQRLRARWPRLPVLFMSGYTSDVLAPHGVLDEGEMLLEKPFSEASLARAVRAALSPSRAVSCGRPSPSGVSSTRRAAPAASS